MNVTVIYGPRASGKTTKLIELARRQNGEPKLLLTHTNSTLEALLRLAPDTVSYARTIYNHHSRGTKTHLKYLFIDMIEDMPPQLVEDIFLLPWRSITMTGAIQYVQPR